MSKPTNKKYKMIKPTKKKIEKQKFSNRGFYKVDNDNQRMENKNKIGNIKWLKVITYNIVIWS